MKSENKILIKINFIIDVNALSSLYYSYFIGQTYKYAVT